MALSVDGLVSGLDTTTIISQLMDLERRPVTLLQNKQTTLADQKAAWQEVNSRLLKFETAANAINTADEFASRSASFSSNNTSGGSVLSVTAGSNTSEGTYNVAVSQIARAQKSASNEAFSSYTSAAGASGTISINGSYNITVSASDTLEEIKNNINSSGAPVTASIINTGTSSSPQYKLILSASDTGTANSFTASDITNLTFATTQAAQDAQFTIDGVSVTKSSNTVTDVIYDATINLETTGSGAVTFSTDYNSIVDKVKTFVGAYNDVMDYIKEQFTYNQNTNEKGALFGNATLEMIQEQVRSVMTNSVPGIDATDTSNLAYLSQVGLKTDEENHLVVNETTFKDLLKTRFDDVKNLFVTSGSGTYTFTSATGKTQGGVYDTRVVDAGGGTAALEMRLQGSSGSWIRLTQNGNFALGQSGSDLEGLILRTGTLSVGDPDGSMKIAIGAAERISVKAGSFTEFSTDGLIFNQYQSIEKQDKDIQSQIDDLDQRITKKEEDLKTKFANLETLLSKLTSQQNYLNSQLGTLSQNWKRA